MIAQRIYQNILRPLPPVPSLVPIFKTTLTTTTDETTTTWTDVDIGVPHPKRIIIIAGCIGASTSVTLTVGGVDNVMPVATSGAGHTRNGAFFVGACPVPNGTVATIAATGSGALRKAVGVYVAYPNVALPVDYGNASANTTTDANVANLKAPAGGFLIYAGGQLATLGTFTTTWNGTNGTVTENYDAQLEAASSITHGFIDRFTTSSDQDDLNMAESVSGTKQLVAVTWGPAYRAYV